MFVTSTLVRFDCLKPFKLCSNPMAESCSQSKMSLKWDCQDDDDDPEEDEREETVSDHEMRKALELLNKAILTLHAHLSLLWLKKLCKNFPSIATFPRQTNKSRCYPSHFFHHFAF